MAMGGPTLLRCGASAHHVQASPMCVPASLSFTALSPLLFSPAACRVGWLTPER